MALLKEQAGRKYSLFFRYVHALIVYFLIELKVRKEDITLCYQEQEVQDCKWVPEKVLREVIKRADQGGFGYGKGEIEGIYPNEDGFGIAEGHFQALRYLFNEDIKDSGEE